MTEAQLATAPLVLSPTVSADPPVVLAPMAGITNTAFRRLCREQLAAANGGAAGGLFVSEMITTRALVERNAKTMRLIRFEPDEWPRSVQLYGIDPDVVGAAVRMIVQDDLADHVDLNFGCPVPKVTRKGGGSALPWRIELFADIVNAAVRNAAGAVPVTVKMRIGIDAEHHTYREAALRAQDAGVKQVALHGRTAADFYGGTADWAPIAELADLLDIPVLGNGDIWEADDALRMVRETGCAGVVVGRGCLGRPWLFADLARAFTGSPGRAMPDLAGVVRTMRRHAELLAQWLGDEARGVIDFRKHVAWYLKGFAVGSDLRTAMASSSSLAELDDLFARLDLTQPFPPAVLGRPRGRTTGTRTVALPEGWLASRGSRSVPVGAELDHSGG
ncbi:tRNA dihydrouridine synthase DusB [Jatrophihabitans cynanchi]|jgi:nifR3 family TIM-barrel protein|uniref:tRNA-dihydrouridine synthase n=1 Tax=Jatrophihabitans cynanchi TaxID=2944128 RepID=A0ABY7JV57_9ACTN|nr:tRNA dihydrouridine synthase DusB [Jatrophihabitans sp. SB3-54]WAX56440.1 tRNA dihydrouridine synthase DusB [Jatrophihabitans sp. SB3-54]